MSLRVVRKLASTDDMTEVEQCIRAMYLTSDGTSCQALMTSEFLSWRNKVIRHILSQSEKVSTRKEASAAPKLFCHDDWELLCHTPESIHAYLNGVKIVYAQDHCCIIQLLPALCRDKPYSQNQEHDITMKQQVNVRQEQSTCIFKKHKTCHSPRQV
jgi:hypothetical protein